MIFVDPESTEGAWLSTSLRQAITLVPEAQARSVRSPSSSGSSINRSRAWAFPS